MGLISHTTMSLNSFVFIFVVMAIFGMSSPRVDAASSQASFTPDCSSGIQYHPHPDSCTKFFQCAHGTAVEKDCPGGTVFHDTYMICVHAGSALDTCSPAHVDRECQRNPALMIPHPTRCQGYYNCSDYVPYRKGGSPWSSGYQKECTFPELFDMRLKECVGYKNVVCGQGREEAKWQCDYYAYQCPVATCRPCYVDIPSCVGKTDGLWPWEYALWSPIYIRCTDERDFEGRLYCSSGELFDPEARKCVQGHLIRSSMVGKG